MKARLNFVCELPVTYQVPLCKLIGSHSQGKKTVLRSLSHVVECYCFSLEAARQILSKESFPIKGVTEVTLRIAS